MKFPFPSPNSMHYYIITKHTSPPMNRDTQKRPFYSSVPSREPRNHRPPACSTQWWRLVSAQQHSINTEREREREGRGVSTYSGWRRPGRVCEGVALAVHHATLHQVRATLVGDELALQTAQLLAGAHLEQAHHQWSLTRSDRCPHAPHINTLG